MISYLKGAIQSADRESAAVVVNGVLGFSVFMHERDLKTLVAEQEVELFCYHHITERSQELYGFLDEYDKKWFVEIIGHVPGIGPKSALKILTKITAATLQRAVQSGDAGTLEANSIGRKTAEKIVAALKGRFEDGRVSTAVVHRPHAYEEALEALISLGYTKSEGEKALAHIDLGAKKTEEVVKEALRLL